MTLNLTLTKTDIDGCFIVPPRRFEDERGVFIERFRVTPIVLENKSPVQFVQGNHVISHKAGTLRGLHCQLMPYMQAKLVEVLRGEIRDVVVDIRPGSATFMKAIHVDMARGTGALYVPKGCLHGYVTKTDNTEVSYLVSDEYVPEYERAVRWDSVDVDWGVKSPIVSDKDAGAPPLSEFIITAS